MELVIIYQVDWLLLKIEVGYQVHYFLTKTYWYDAI